MARMSAETETSIRDRILDAAGACLVDFGIQRTTINEIAERSSLSRTRSLPPTSGESSNSSSPT